LFCETSSNTTSRAGGARAGAAYHEHRICHPVGAYRQGKRSAVSVHEPGLWLPNLRRMLGGRLLLLHARRKGRLGRGERRNSSRTRCRATRPESEWRGGVPALREGQGAQDEFSRSFWFCRRALSNRREFQRSHRLSIHSTTAGGDVEL